MFERILVVCVGNICRSPMAEILLREGLQRKGIAAQVRSAGLAALIGYPADEQVHWLMQRRGLDVSTHRARQLEREAIHWAELILVMEEPHRLSIRSIEPSATGKVFLLGHWLDSEIPDPYQKGRAAFEAAELLIDQAVESWVKRL